MPRKHVIDEWLHVNKSISANVVVTMYSECVRRDKMLCKKDVKFTSRSGLNFSLPIIASGFCSAAVLTANCLWCDALPSQVTFVGNQLFPELLHLCWQLLRVGVSWVTGFGLQQQYTILVMIIGNSINSCSLPFEVMCMSLRAGFRFWTSRLPIPDGLFTLHPDVSQLTGYFRLVCRSGIKLVFCNYWEFCHVSERFCWKSVSSRLWNRRFVQKS